jgi:predicted O-methyltransferase YrrM
MNDLLNYQDVQGFLNTLVPRRPDEMLAMEKYAEENHFPIIGPAAGYMCYQIARLIGARSIFEMGSGYGYSTAWFARAVKENSAARGTTEGRVHHVVWDAKLSQMAAEHLARLGLGSFVQFHVAEAVETLQGMPGGLDLVFNDINKESYPASLPVIKEKLRPGGVLITDNILWSGRIFDEKDQSPSTEGVREFTRLISQDRDWIVSVLPVRDGVMVALKK